MHGQAECVHTDGVCHLKTLVLTNGVWTRPEGRKDEEGKDGWEREGGHNRIYRDPEGIAAAKRTNFRSVTVRIVIDLTCFLSLKLRFKQGSFCLG